MRNPNSNKNLNNSNHSKLNLENLKKSIKINQNLLNEIERLLK